MYRRVVVGVDLGGASIDAATWLARHIEPEELVLCHVVRPLHPPAYIRGALVDPVAILETELQQASARMHEMRSRLGVDCTVDVRTGDPARQLEAAVLEHDAEVLVIGEHGARRAAADVRSRTAFALMARAAVPVWFARSLPEGPPRAVLAAVGAGPTPVTNVIETARAAQQAWNARASLIHVVDRLFVPRPDTEEVSQHSLDDAIRREAETWLGEQRRRARVRGTDVPLEVVIGDPASELLAAIYRGEHDLLVMRGPMAGSDSLPDRVSRALMAASPASLLRLPTTDEPREAA